MVKTIEVEPGKTVDFKASAFTPIQYNKLFPNRDYLKDINDLKMLNEARKRNAENADGDELEKKMAGVTLAMDDYEQFVRVAYCFAYQALAPSPRPTDEQKEFRMKFPDPWDWIDTFETFSIYEILPEIIDMWFANEKSKSTAKNSVPAPPAK